MALATKKAIDFDNGMRQVATMLPKLSKEGFGSLKQETLEFAKEIGKVPEEVIPALYNALSAGIPRENVFDFLRTAFRELPAPIQTAVVGFVGLAAGFGPVLNGLLSLGKGFADAKRTMKDFGKSVGLLKDYIVYGKNLTGVWKALNTVIVASPVGIITAVTVGLGALAVKAYKTGQELKKLREELNTNTYKNIGEFNTVTRKITTRIKRKRAGFG